MRYDIAQVLRVSTTCVYTPSVAAGGIMPRHSFPIRSTMTIIGRQAPNYNFGDEYVSLAGYRCYWSVTLLLVMAHRC